MEILKLYWEYIIEPIEKEIKNTKYRISKKRYFLTRQTDLEYLQKLENLLNEYYQKLNVLMQKN